MKLREFLNKLAQKAHQRNEANLLSFSPQKTSRSNQYILRQIKVATSIKNRQDNNIALDGDYGVGKSSILYGLKNNLMWRIVNRPKTISFLSFSTDKKIESKELQSEIIRQLYYGERPDKLKGSGYKRIGKHYLFSSLLVGIILGSYVSFQIYHIDIQTLIDALINYSVKDVDTSVPSNFSWVWIFSVIALTLATNIIFKFISNGNIKNISAKDLSIELLDKEPDFDQLIDLLIYYFRKTKRRIVIFEDLDRLKNPKIFEELRQLNFTLNNRIKPFGTIKFIYATRSDLFVANATDDTGIEKINTKVFDLIIPVIPFLTKVNFSNILQDECKTIGLDWEINGVENILSRHTSDMRVVKAVLNDMLVYKNTFDLQTDDDYKNVAALSILRVFAPDDYMRLSTGNSLLDFAREQCLVKKEASIKQARERHTPEYKIKQNSKTIWTAIRNIGNRLPQNANPQHIVINNEQITANDDSLIKIYKTEQNSNIQIYWGNYGQRSYATQQLRDIIAPYTKENPLGTPIEKEVKELAERDCFAFYDGSIVLTDEVSDKKTQGIVKELLENAFITEGYTRLITQATNMDKDVDQALRYIFGYIRSNKRNDEYVLSPETATEIIARIDNTDLLSTGMYNYDLFDFIIRNIDQYSNKLDRILQNAKVELSSFMDFFDNYCCKYKSELESESCAGLTESSIMDLSKTIPPVFLVMKLAKMYPEELMAKVSQSSLKDTNAKEVIYDIAVISLDNPLNMVLEKHDCSFLTYYADTIIKNENGKENLFKLFIANNIPVSDLKVFNVSNDDVKNYLDRILIVINEQNLAILEDDVLINYVTMHQLTIDSFKAIMNSNKSNVKQYIVKNIEKVVINDSLPGCVQEAAAYIYEKKISLTQDELFQYAGKTNTKNLIGIIVIPDLTREEIVAIMAKCDDGNLSKIQVKNSLIKLNSSRSNETFAKKLETLGLVKRQNSRNHKIIRLQVL